MAIEVHTNSDATISALVRGIAKDLQELLKQQLALFKYELQDDLARTKTAGRFLVVGLVALMMGAGLLLLTLVFFLNWATTLPLWGCFGIVGGVLTLAGGILVGMGKKKLSALKLLPVQSAQALKENLRCMTNP
jgi:putative superfamily III holin-X